MPSTITESNKPSPAGEGGSRRLTDEVLPCVYCQNGLYLAMFAPRPTPKLLTQSRRRRDWGNGHIREACVLASPRQGSSAPQSAKFPNVHNLFTNKSAKSIVILHKIWYNTDASMINALHAI